MHIFTCVRTYLHTHVHIYIHTYMHTYLHMHAYLHIYVRTCIHTDISPSVFFLFISVRVLLLVYGVCVCVIVCAFFYVCGLVFVWGVCMFVGVCLCLSVRKCVCACFLDRQSVGSQPTHSDEVGGHEYGNHPRAARRVSSRHPQRPR